MKLWTAVVLSLHIWAINANKEVESNNGPEQQAYSAQFLQNDELFLSTASSNGEQQDTVKELTVSTTDSKNNKTSEQTFLKNATFDEESKSIMKVSDDTVLKTRDFTTEINIGNSVLTTSNDTKTSKSDSNNQNHNTTEINNEHISTKNSFRNDTEHLKHTIDLVKTKKELNESSNRSNNSSNYDKAKSNVSFIFSKPYQPGKDLYDSEKIIVIYPDKTDQISNRSMGIYNNKSSSTLNRKNITNTSIDSNPIKGENNVKIVKMKSTVEEMSEGRIKQIRHGLYRRRPVTHNFLKMKTNDKSLSNKDEAMNDTIQEGTENMFMTKKMYNNLKKMKNSDFVSILNDSTIENVNKTRKIYGMLSDNEEDRDHNEQSAGILTVQNENTTLRNREGTGKDSMNATFSTTKNVTVPKRDHLFTSETQVHSSVVYRNKTDDDSYVEMQQQIDLSKSHDEMNNAKISFNKEIINKNSQKPEESSNTRQINMEKPFKPSPEYNPKDIRRYNMNFQPLDYTFPRNQNTHLTRQHAENSHESSKIGTTTEPNPTLIENMIRMLQNLRQLPKRRRINNPQISNRSTDDLEHIRNYELKKIRPLQINQTSQPIRNVQPKLVERNNDGTVSVISNDTQIFFRNNQRNAVRRPGLFRMLSKPTRIVLPILHSEHPKPMFKSSNHTNVDNINMNKENHKISTMHKPLQLEHALKTNILMDLENIKMMLQPQQVQNTSQPVQLENQSQNTSTASLHNQHLKLNRTLERPSLSPLLSRRKEMMGKLINSTILSKTMNQRLSYLRNRLSKPVKDETSTRNPEMNAEKTENLQEIKMRPTSRQRYQETKMEHDSNKSNGTITGRHNYRTRPSARVNRFMDHESNNKNATEIRQNNLITNKTDMAVNSSQHTDVREIILNARRRNKFRNRKINEKLGNNEDQAETMDSKKIINNSTTEDSKLALTNNDNHNLNYTSDSNKVKIHDNKSTRSNFNNKEFELQDSGSEMVENRLELNNKKFVQNSNPMNMNDMDLVSLESKQNERSIYTGSRFFPPIEFENGFVPMLFELNGGIVGPIPRAVKDTSERKSTPQLKLPESEDQVQNFNIISPNLLTTFGTIGRIPQLLNNNGNMDDNNDKKTVKDSDSEDAKKPDDVKTETPQYETALMQYNKALKIYNDYLEQFIQNKQQ